MADNFRGLKMSPLPFKKVKAKVFAFVFSVKRREANTFISELLTMKLSPFPLIRKQCPYYTYNAVAA